jgi:hypothetical protein
MAGILGGLPPGLQGWVLADQLNQQKQAGKMQELQGILGMQGALAQQQQAAQMAPLQLEAARMKIDAMRNPGPKWEVKEIFDKDGRKQKVAINLLDPSSPPIPIGGSEAVRMEVSPAGEAYNPYGLKPGQRIDVTTPHQTWQQNTQFPTQVGIDLARLNQPVLSEAAGGWVPRPQVSLPGFGGVPMAPRAPQGQMPSAMDATPRISPNMMVSPQDQARRDQEAARIRAAEQQPNGGGMLPTNSVIPVPGLGGPKAPPGYEPDPAKPGALRPIPGGPADIKAGEAGAKADLQLQRGISRANTVISKVDEALNKVGFFSTGIHGAVLGNIPGTNAYNLERTLDTIKANIGFEQLEQMRAASPTGGALGSIAVRELDFLQAAIASLDKGQGRADLEKNLAAVKTHYMNWKNAVELSKASGGSSSAPRRPSYLDIPKTNSTDLFKAADEIIAGGRP